MLLRFFFFFLRYNKSTENLTWKNIQGLDSGLFVINKRKSKIALNFFQNEILTNLDWWLDNEYSMGDKDLWHLSWDLTNSNYTYIPTVGGYGQTDWQISSKWYMTGQCKPLKLFYILIGSKDVVFVSKPARLLI